MKAVGWVGKLWSVQRGFLAKVVYKKEPVRNASWHQAVESAVDAVRVLSGQQAALYQLL